MKQWVDYIGVGCGGLVVNDTNQVLLMRRAGTVINRAGRWTQPWGKVEFGDTIEETVIRELKEEIGVDVEVLDFLCLTNQIIKEEGQHRLAPSYLVRIIGGEPTNMEPNKCDALEWFDLDKLPEKLVETTVDSTRSYRKILWV